jgi:hypothetical protein
VLEISEQRLVAVGFIEGSLSGSSDGGFGRVGDHRPSADRIILTGDSAELAEQQVAVTKLNPKIRGLAIYNSDSAKHLT